MANEALGVDIDQYLGTDGPSFAVWMLTDGDFAAALTDEGWEEFLRTFDAACLEKNQPAGKLFVQVFNHDPDFTGDPDPEQKPWVGLEFDYTLSDYGIDIGPFNKFYPPRSDVEPAFDPYLEDHVYVVIPYDALDLEFADNLSDA